MDIAGRGRGRRGRRGRANRRRCAGRRPHRAVRRLDAARGPRAGQRSRPRLVAGHALVRRRPRGAARPRALQLRDGQGEPARPDRRAAHPRSIASRASSATRSAADVYEAGAARRLRRSSAAAARPGAAGPRPRRPLRLLFPGDAALGERQRWVVGVETPGMPPLVSRVTVTLPVLNAARDVVFLISGEDKAEAVARAFGDAPGQDAPASLVRPDRGTLTVLLDPPAALAPRRDARDQLQPAQRHLHDGQRDLRHRGPVRHRQGHRLEPLPADRRLWLPLRLRDHGPRGAERQRGVDVPAAHGLAERVRLDPRPRRRQLPARPRRHPGPGLAALPARHDGARDQLGHARRLDHRARRAADRSLAPRERALDHPPALAHRLRRRPRPAADRPLRERRGADPPGLRAGVQLRARLRHAGSTRDLATTRRRPRPREAT